MRYHGTRESRGRTMADFSFRQFQEELRKLDGGQPNNSSPPAPGTTPTPIKPSAKPLSKKELEAKRLEKARAEFLELRVRHGWSLEDVVAFFPEEEGVGFLLKLLQEPVKRKRRVSAPQSVAEQEPKSASRSVESEP